MPDHKLGCAAAPNAFSPGPCSLRCGQPDVAIGKEDVTQFILNSLRDMLKEPLFGGQTERINTLIQKLTERREHGIAKYGTSLMTWNGRDPLNDALEEQLDLIQYLVQARKERADLLIQRDALAEENGLLKSSLAQANLERIRFQNQLRDVGLDTPMDMTLDQYQRAAVRTALKADKPMKLMGSALGLCGEAGEYADLIKKHVMHEHPLDNVKAVKELGDVLWYVADCAHALGATLESIARTNIEKLEKRYVSGAFSVEESKKHVTQSGNKPDKCGTCGGSAMDAQVMSRRDGVRCKDPFHTGNVP